MKRSENGVATTLTLASATTRRQMTSCFIVSHRFIFVNFSVLLLTGMKTMDINNSGIVFFSCALTS